MSGQAVAGLFVFAASLVLAPATQAQSNFSTPYTITTFAGTALTGGSTNATGTAARFFYPGGVAVDASGNVYVADAGNNVVRKITAAGVVTTFAGQVGAAAGTADGTGAAIQFSALGGVAVDNQGDVYVADVINSTIRKITPGGVSSTLAGTPGVQGFANGPGSSALFNRPNGVAVDGAGNVYVADTGNGVVRKVTAAGVVTTLAGVPGGFGTVNGTNGVALFNGLYGIAVDPSGNVFVSDSVAGTIRKITPTGTVTTFAGTAGLYGSADGTGTAALFNSPGYIATDGSGNVYVADTNSSSIRRITPAGVVSTLAGEPQGVITSNPGAPIVTGSKDGTGSVAQFNFPRGIAATAAGNIYIADTNNFTIRAGVPPSAVAAPVLNTQVTSQAAAAGANVTFSVAATGTGLSYQWAFNGTAISGATGSSLTISKIAAANAGAYTVTVTNSGGSITSGAATLALVTPPATSSYASPYAITTLAGTAGSYGTATGTGAAARFTSPVGSAVDSSGNVYVTDAGSGTVLKITPAGVVTVLAGTAGVYGSANGTGAAAQFVLPFGSAVDSAGNVYVSDYGSSTVRKITAAGVVTTLAGTAGVYGSADGTGAAVQFDNPAGVAVDASGNVYVADSYNDTIRKITAAGVSSTLAGTAGVFGSANGTGAAAQFNFPVAVAVDASGNVYVADAFNNTIRKVTSAGVVTTLAGTAGVTGSADGTGAAAQFSLPQGVAVDAAGNLYVSDGGNNTIRRITAAGVVTTLAGVAGTAGAIDGTGPTAEFNSPYGIAVDGSSSIYVADSINGTVRKGSVPPPAAVAPVITAQPQSVTVATGSPFSLSVTATGTATLTYQWFLAGAAISGATSSTYAVATAAAANAGSYTVTVSNAAGSATSTAAVVTVSAAAPVITAQPQGVSTTVGSLFSLSVTATGSGTLTYQWLFGGTAIAGANGPTYVVAAATTANAGNYTVTVTNAGGSVTSSAAAVTVSAAAAAPAAPASGGGGGAPSLWFDAALLAVAAARVATRRQKRLRA
jgi:sugar lactone lactonase YvrE